MFRLQHFLFARDVGLLAVNGFDPCFHTRVSCKGMEDRDHARRLVLQRFSGMGPDPVEMVGAVKTQSMYWQCSSHDFNISIDDVMNLEGLAVMLMAYERK